MKKISTILLAFVMSFVIVCPVLAADFTPSISYKPAPELILLMSEDGYPIAGYMYDEDGYPIAVVNEEYLVITPISEVDSSDEIPESAAYNLRRLYNDFVTGKSKLSDIETLNKLAAEVLGEGHNGDSFVIRDFFDISMLCDDYELLKQDGTYIDLTFKLGVAAETYVTAMVYVDGEWVLIDVTNNGDGTVTGRFTDFGTVMFLVPGNEVEVDSDVIVKTGDATGNHIAVWSTVAVVSLAGICALFIYRRKRSR